MFWGTMAPLFVRFCTISSSLCSSVSRALPTSAAEQTLSGRTHRVYRAAARRPVRVERSSGASMAWDTDMPSGSTAFKRASKSWGPMSPSNRTSNHSRSLSNPVDRAPAKAMSGWGLKPWE